MVQGHTLLRSKFAVQSIEPELTQLRRQIPVLLGIEEGVYRRRG